MRIRGLPARLAMLAVVSSAVACGSAFDSGTRPAGSGAPSGAGGSPGDPDAGGAEPFEPLSPNVYGTKVKNLLVGLPLTDEELTVLTADPGAFPSMIDAWMARPEWRDRMLVFFKQAFQQTQVSLLDYNDSLDFKFAKKPLFTATPLLRSLEEMFPRTVLQLIDEKRPFTEVVTTERFMLNSSLMSLIAQGDAKPQDDDQKEVLAGFWLLAKYPNLTFTEETTPIPLADSVNPASPNFMHWYDPKPVKVAAGDKCAQPQTFQNPRQALKLVGEFLYGQRAPAGCGTTDSQFSDQDFTDWRMITVRQPVAPDEEKTTFWDIPRIRAASELVVQTPRVGFMTTPAFFANWPTNSSNQARVTTNQTMIVALGLAFDDRGITVPVQSSAGDAAHAQPGTVCYACHQTLDPMRDFFRESYTYLYSTRFDSAKGQIPPTGTFNVPGEDQSVAGTGIRDLAQAIIKSPRFATAWTQKVCRFANSTSCSEEDPEFLRIAQVFRDSTFDFKIMMREMLSSPLVTFASPTKSAQDQGIVIGIARKDTLCASLGNRLGILDLCGTLGISRDVHAENLATAIPGDGYARGAEAPLMPHDPNLFFASATENMCNLLAARLVDAGAGSRYTSAAKDEALADFVTSVMGVPPSDARASGLRAILGKHFDGATAAGQAPSDALRSTFVLSCSSPLSVSSGL
jgi:hypothetical protein